MNRFYIALACSVAMTACSEKNVSFDTLETARTQAKENALWNAQAYRQANVLYRGWDIIGRGDSTQMPNCPQGDGWATMDFVSMDKTTVTKIKCSTVSTALGCLEDSDFKTKSYASEDGHCQDIDKVPFPFRKLTQ